MTKKYDVLGIGNAIVDVIASCEDQFLSDMGIEKGIMQLIETDRAVELYEAMVQTTQISGGSAANTIAALAELGSATSFTGMVKQDILGAIFADGMNDIGVDFIETRAPSTHAAETARSMILVTPDGERSMNTYLGVSVDLAPEHIDPARMADTQWIYLEGYLFDRDRNKSAFIKAVELVKAAGGKVSLSLSDPFCVDRHREAFKDLVANHVDLLFCNEHELISLYETETVEAAFDLCAGPDTVACTASEKGAYVLTGGTITQVAARPTKLVDATGAGDAFAAGYLYGVVNGKDAPVCAEIGCTLAADVISHIGARAQTDLKALVSDI